ncbi:MAG: diphthamide synthesis protein [Nanoarchaeota archaeon]
MKMHKKSIKEIKDEYELDLDAISGELKKVTSDKKSNMIVLFQFPDGMKPYSTTIVDYFAEKFPLVSFLIWMESCFGACDVPVIGSQLEKKIDLVVQFGHVQWHNNSPIWEA